MSNRRNLPDAGRQAGTRLLAAGALGSAAVMALHGAASVADADGQAAPAQPGVQTASLAASVTLAPAIYYKAPPAPGTVLPGIPLPQPRPSSAPQAPLPAPEPVQDQPPAPPPAPVLVPAPGPDQFGAGAQPVQLYQGLTAVPPSMLSQLGNALATGSVSVSASRYPLFGFLGGTVGASVGADGGAIQLGAGAGIGGDVKVGISDTPPTTNPSLQIVGQVTDGLYMPGATSPVASFKGQVNYTLLGPSGASATGQVSVGNWQVSQTMPLGGPSGPGPNTSDQGGSDGGPGAQSGAYKLQSFGSQTSVQAMATIPFTWQDLVRGLVSGAAVSSGFTPEQAQQAALQAWPDPTPQQMIDRDFAQLNAGGYPVQTGTMPAPSGPVAPAVQYLYTGTPDGLLNPLTGSVSAPGPANPITGVPDSVSGNTGAQVLPWPVMAPAPPQPAAVQPVPDPLPYAEPFPGLKLYYDTTGQATPEAPATQTAQADQTAPPAQPAQTADTPPPAPAPSSDTQSASTDQAPPDGQLVTVTDATDSATMASGSSGSA